MALININNGALAKSSVLNDNFIFLDEKIAKTAQTLDAKIGLVSNNASTVTSNLAITQSTVNNLNDVLTALTESNEGKASKDLSDVTITEEFAEKLISAVMPDYSSGISISSGYVATTNGLAYFQGIPDGGSSITIDGVSFQVSYDTGDGQSNGDLSMLVGKGSVIAGFSRIASARFYPCKGV